MELLHFKLRVLDMVQTYVVNLPQSPLIFVFLNPMLEALVRARDDKTQEPLANAIESVIRKITLAKV